MTLPKLTLQEPGRLLEVLYTGLEHPSPCKIWRRSWLGSPGTRPPSGGTVPGIGASFPPTQNLLLTLTTPFLVPEPSQVTAEAILVLNKKKNMLPNGLKYAPKQLWTNLQPWSVKWFLGALNMLVLVLFKNQTLYTPSGTDYHFPRYNSLLTMPNQRINPYNQSLGHQSTGCHKARQGIGFSFLPITLILSHKPAYEKS